MDYLPENTADFSSPDCTLGPLLEACLVYIVAASGFAPYNIFSLRFEFCKADWAVAGDFFTVGRAGRGGYFRIDGRQYRGGKGKNGLQFLKVEIYQSMIDK